MDTMRWLAPPTLDRTRIRKHLRYPLAFSLVMSPRTYGYWYGPGFSQWDLALMKEFSLGNETRRLQLRFEAQKVLDHMNAGNPLTGVTSSGFGQIITQAGNPPKP